MNNSEPLGENETPLDRLIKTSKMLKNISEVLYPQQDYLLNILKKQNSSN